MGSRAKRERRIMTKRLKMRTISTRKLLGVLTALKLYQNPHWTVFEYVGRLSE